MRFLTYLFTLLSVLSVFVSGIAFALLIEDGRIWLGVLVAVLAVAGFTAVLGSTIWELSQR